MNRTCGSSTSLFKEEDTSDFGSVKLTDRLCVTLTGITGTSRLPLVRVKIFSHLDAV